MFEELLLPFDPEAYSPAELQDPRLSGRLTVIAIQHEQDLVTVNVPDLRAGDVILFRNQRRWLRDAFDPIVGYQRILFPPSAYPNAAYWTHVGLLDENMQVWDAMPS